VSSLGCQRARWERREGLQWPCRRHAVRAGGWEGQEERGREKESPRRCRREGETSDAVGVPRLGAKRHRRSMCFVGSPLGAAATKSDIRDFLQERQIGMVREL